MHGIVLFINDKKKAALVILGAAFLQEFYSLIHLFP